MAEHPRAARYRDLAWLIRCGESVEGSMRRLGIPSAEAALRWAHRHNDQVIRDAVAHLAAAERYQRKTGLA